MKKYIVGFFIFLFLWGIKFIFPTSFIQVFPDTYIAAIYESANQEVILLMEEKGYIFIEQLGAGYIFKDASGQRIVATTQKFTRYFTILEVSKMP